jgi:hypothetical protein
MKADLLLTYTVVGGTVYLYQLPTPQVLPVANRKGLGRAGQHSVEKLLNNSI